MSSAPKELYHCTIFVKNDLLKVGPGFYTRWDLRRGQDFEGSAVSDESKRTLIGLVGMKIRVRVEADPQIMVAGGGG